MVSHDTLALALALALVPQNRLLITVLPLLGMYTLYLCTYLLGHGAWVE